MTLPIAITPAMERNLPTMHGEAGADWLRRLPGIIADRVAGWGLRLEPPFSDLWHNYVSPAALADGTPVVLKVCFPGRELYTEAEALRHYEGHGACRLLAADLEAGAMLIERVLPGEQLSTVTDNQAAVRIAADVMGRIWRPAPPETVCPSMDDWIGHMAEKAPALLARYSDFPGAWIERALGLYGELRAGAAPPVLLHGDLHHYNILSARREPWLAIDPQGVVGEPLWEVGPFLYNELPADHASAEARAKTWQRVGLFAELLGIDRERVRLAGVVRCVLSAYWSMEDGGGGWQDAITLASVLDGG